RARTRQRAACRAVSARRAQRACAVPIAWARGPVGSRWLPRATCRAGSGGDSGMSNGAPVPAEFRVDGREVRRSFGRAAHDYDAAAVLQAEVRKELLGRLDLVRLVPDVVLDLGAGTGRATIELKRRYRRSQV